MCLFCCSADVFLVLLAIVFPPLPVWVKRGICSADSLINIALCMLGFIPGLLHSWYIIARYPEDPFLDVGDLEAQEFGRQQRGGLTTFYSRQQFVYSPIPQQDSGSHATNAVESNMAHPPGASVPVQPEAGSSSMDAVPPAYEDVVRNQDNGIVKDNKIQRNEQP
ncbi:hypothetical protein V1511DRAFT_492728 [Dipodascopsis uninucleata]